MRRLLRKLRGVMGIGLTWGALWAAITASIGLAIGVLDPDSIDPGEGMLHAMSIVGINGFVAGLGFGVLLSAAEIRKTILDLSLIRVGIWGTAAAAALPFLTGMPTDTLMIVCPLGAACASASVAIARRSERHHSPPPKLLNPLLDVLASAEDTPEAAGTDVLLRAVDEPHALADSLVRPAGSAPREPEYLLHLLPNVPTTIPDRATVPQTVRPEDAPSRNSPDALVNHSI